MYGTVCSGAPKMGYRLPELSVVLCNMLLLLLALHYLSLYCALLAYC